MQRTIWFLFCVWCQVVASSTTCQAELQGRKAIAATGYVSAIQEGEAGEVTLFLGLPNEELKLKFESIALITSNDGDSISWVLKVSADGNLQFSTEHKLTKRGDAVQFSAPPGRYAVLGKNGGEPLIIQIGEQPGPGPVPTPAGEFELGGWIMLIEETAERTPATAAITNNLTWWSSVRNRGYKWRFYDKDQATPNLLAHANQVGLPALVFVQPSGKVWKSIKLPATIGEIDLLLKPAVSARWVQVCPGDGQPCYWVEVQQ